MGMGNGDWGMGNGQEVREQGEREKSFPLSKSSTPSLSLFSMPYSPIPNPQSLIPRRYICKWWC